MIFFIKLNNKILIHNYLIFLHELYYFKLLLFIFAIITNIKILLNNKFIYLFFL